MLIVYVVIRLESQRGLGCLVPVLYVVLVVDRRRGVELN